MKGRSFPAAILPILLVASCASPRPESPVAPPAWVQAPRDGWALQADWWKSFGDPRLGNLIHEGWNSNPEVEIALQRIESARADRFEAMAALFPKAGISAGYRQGREQDRTTGYRPDDLEPWTADGGISWELDVTGKRGARIASAKAGEAAAFARWQGVRLLVATEIASARFEDAVLSAEIDRHDRQLEDEEKALAMSAQILANGLISSAQHAARTSEAGQLKREVSDLRRLRDTARLRLTRLLGGSSAPSVRSGFLPTLPQAPLRVPADVWGTRPDLLAAEAEVRAAFALQDAARLDLLPSLSLGAGGSLGTNSLSGQLKTWELSAGPRLEIPVWDPSRIAAVRRSQASAASAAASYRSAALKAVEEIETAYLGYTHLRSQYDSLGRECTDLLTAWNDAKSKAASGAGSLLEAADAGRNYHAATRLRGRVLLRTLDEYLVLVRALGG